MAWRPEYAIILGKLSKYLFLRQLLQAARLDAKHFTRCRTLTLPTVLSFLLSSVHAAVQSELDQFFANLPNRADSVREVTAQAFYQARYKISALVFCGVNQHLMELVEEHLPNPRWRGLRVVAADGSAVRLTMMKDNVRSIVTGMAFGLYLRGIELFLNFRLHERLSDERQMFFEAIDCLRSDDVLVMERGFPCRWLVLALTARDIRFCIRCDLSRRFRVVREFLQSSRSEQVVVLRAPNARDAKDYECPATPTTVRFVRVVTPNGQVHGVMTSLLDPETFPPAAFADLFHGRWRIEEAFKRIKHRLQLVERSDNTITK